MSNELEYLKKKIPKVINSKEELDITLGNVSNYLYTALGFLENPMERITIGNKIGNKKGMIWHGHHFRQKIINDIITEMKDRLSHVSFET